jgi:DnaJ-class molecular chaperone
MNNNMAKGFLDGYKTYDTSKGMGNAKKWKQSLYQRMSREEATAIFNNDTNAAYCLLGLVPGATVAQIKKAYRRLALQWHPDTNPHRIAEAEEMMKKIIAAYTLLT